VTVGADPGEKVTAALPAVRDAVGRAVASMSAVATMPAAETSSRPRSSSPNDSPDEVPPMPELHVEVPGGRLFVRDVGSGPPIVLLHASVVDSWAWEPLAPLLLDAGYRIVAFDRRGSAASVTDDVAFSHRADTLAVMDALGIGRACLIGNSMGALIAIDTAAEHPNRCTAVVALAPAVTGFWPEPTPEEAALFEEMERLEASGDADAIADLDVRACVDGPGQPIDRVPSEIRELVRDMDRAANAPGRVKGRPIQLDPPASERLDGLTMPILAVVGGLDFSETMAAGRFLEERVPSARLLVMPDVAHMIALEAPAELAAEIVALLAPLPRWS
jgi:pimeloyl-ACP methyl ester carboxylesterase